MLALASGLVFAGSTPPTDLRFGILGGLVVFAFALLAPDTPDASARTAAKAGAWRGFLFGLGANVLALRFVPEVIERFTPLPALAGWVALLLLAAAQALPWTIGGAVTACLARGRRTLAPPFLAFATGVYVATFVPALFPWTPAGGLSPFPVLLQSAELVGERGTSFLLAASCGLLATGVIALASAIGRGRASSTGSAVDDRASALGSAALSTGAALASVGLLLAHGSLRMRAVERTRAESPHVRVALLDPDFDAMARWDEARAATMIAVLSKLTREAEADGATLTVWPESAYPYTLAHGVRRSPRGARALLQLGARGPVLTGAYLSKGGGLGTNSAILVEPDGSIGPSYDKRHLLWFGETVPLGDTFPVLRRIFARGTGLVPGERSTAFRVGPIVLAVLDCYEDTLPRAGREAMEARPSLLVNVTNDAWFAGSAEGELHLRLAALRAIETRRDLVRSVNRGPTTWIDASGNVRARQSSAPGLGPLPPLLVEPALLSTPPTPYVRAGDAPLALAIAGSLVVAALRRRRRRRRRVRP